MGYIRGADRNQIILFPECMDEYISDDNSVRVIDEYVEQLDIKNLGFDKAESACTGRPAYNPKDLLKLYIYGFLNRIRSSRRLEQEGIRNIEVIWLLKKLRPDFKTIADFRKNNKKAIKNVFREFNKLCDEWGLFGKELVAIDGSKFRASNSKRNNFSKKKIERHLKYIEEKIDVYMKELDETDQTERCDKKCNVREIKDKIKELRERKQHYEFFNERIKSGVVNEISTTDPDARLMVGNNNAVDVCYNVQTTVDTKNKLIVDFKVSQKPNDLGELDNMALRTKKLFGGKYFEVLADKGYYKAEDLKKCIDNNIIPYVTKQTYSNATGDKDFYSDKFKYDKNKNVYICPGNKELYFFRNRTKKDVGIIGYEYRNFEECAKCEYKSRCTKSKKGRVINRNKKQDFLDTIDLQTELNKEKYKLRQMIVEHPFGTIKRGWGASYFLTRRKKNTTTEMAITFLSYNMKRVINILGNSIILKRLRERKKLALV